MDSFLIVFRHKKMMENHHEMSDEECSLEPMNYIVRGEELQKFKVSKRDSIDQRCYFHVLMTVMNYLYAKQMVLLNKYLMTKYATGLFEIDNIVILNIINLGRSF